MTYAVIMAGGSGTRFWPKSTSSLPKQFLKLFGDRTMLQSTVDRVSELIPIENVLVVTNDKYVGIVKDQLPCIPDENVIAEVVAKNTAPCVAIAASILEGKDEESVMVVLPADHHITEPKKFVDFLSTAIEKAKNENALVTIGITPDKPETGYGYIHADESKNEEISGNSVLGVHGFREKPDLETAKEFLASGDFFWNSGMFIWKSSNVMKSIQAFLPNMHALTQDASALNYSKDSIDHFYQSSESISIDYGIMEKAENVFVVPGEFGWNDVGSWSAAYELSEKDDHGNHIEAKEKVIVDSSNNYISLNSDKMISLVGVDNLTIVETDTAILICDIDKAQDVKKVVDALKSEEDLKKFL